MRLIVNFSLKRSKSRANGKCPVYVRCTMNHQRFELSTGVFVIPEYWDDQKQRVNRRTEEAKVLNNRLVKVDTRIQDVYNQLESQGEPFSVINVKTKLLGISNNKGVLEVLDGIIKSIDSRIGNDYSEGTLKHYKTSRKRLAGFFKSKFGRTDLALTAVDYNFLSSFDLYLKAELRLRPNHQRSRKVNHKENF
ncbi:phage integrase SAM-like domain-containing protein [Sunxiuqinia indica]|uniref:phage integrase SAM-like domain-containing protein n=1 Tax=Sunxiuqinia indica TaxID=2692584 RepID=UPI001356A7D6|nr:phage integrase SAM-like domain-containing protein [Sunxiuqinia indica]